MEEKKNNTQAELQPKLIQTLFELEVAKHPHTPALSYLSKEYSYYAINAKANQLANYIRKKTSKSNGAIAVCLEPSPELIIAILAILKTGNAYVPLDMNYPMERLHFMLEDTKTEILITQNNFLEKLNNTNLTCIDINREHLNNFSIDNLELMINPESTACIIYTSGSTGKPKGVMISHRNINNFNLWFSQATKITTQDIYDFSSSIAFDFSIATTLFPLLNGARVAICPELARKDPYLYIKHLLASRVTNIKITPSHFRQFKETVNNEYDFPDLHSIIFGGEALYKEDIEDWLTKYPQQRIINEYGPTEATVATSWMAIIYEDLPELQMAVPIGKPALNTQMYILNKKLRPVAIGEQGELYIGGASVTKGYLNRPKLTAERFIKNPFSKNETLLYKTGDLCKYMPDGNIEFIGRVDHQIKIRGYRVELNEIEKKMLTHPSIKAAIVQADESINQHDDKYLIAYFIPKSLQLIPTAEELKKFLHASLPGYMVPAFFVPLTSFPLTANGKIDRKLLPNADLVNQYSLAKPQTELEKLLSEIWIEVLGLKEVGITTNFFELGGHSLSAARIISKIKQKWQKEIKLQDFYQCPTIKELAVLLAATQTLQSSKINADVKVSKTAIPLNDLQFMLWLTKHFYLKAHALNIVSRKRVNGRIAPNKLRKTIVALVAHHSVLKYHISTFKPLQLPQASVEVNFEAINLQKLSEQDAENELVSSLEYLQSFQDWKAQHALIYVRLFRLANGKSEIQICLPHIISDEVSAEVIFKELSLVYTGAENLDGIDNLFIESILHENQQMNKTLKRNMKFWDAYLQDAEPIQFPQQYILNNKEITQASTSSYREISTQELLKLQAICTKVRISLPDLLCAIVSKSLLAYMKVNSANSRQILAFNFVKSTRVSDADYQALGLFIRPYLVKVELTQDANLISLAKQIQKSAARTAPYQICPAIVKIGSLFQKSWGRHGFLNKIINPISYLLSIPLAKFKLNQAIIALYCKMYFGLKKDSFMVQVNLLNSFIPAPQDKNKQLFGYELEQPQDYKQEKIVAKNILDISFAKGLDDKFYVIVASNLKQELLAEISHEILKNILQYTKVENALQAEQENRDTSTV